MGLSCLDFARHQRVLHLADSTGHLDSTRASFNAVEDGPAAPGAIACSQNIEALVATFIAAAEDEAMGIDDGGGSNVLRVCPVRRTRTGASGAEYALGGVIEAGPLSG